jgi:hypothetical protein
MAQLIDLEGLPEPVATAIAETVVNLKKHYRTANKEQHAVEPLKDLPSWPGKVIGSLRRVDIY